MRKTKSAGDEIVTMDRRSTKERRAEPRTKTESKAVESKASSTKTDASKTAASTATIRKPSEPKHLETNNKRFQADRRNRESIPDNMAKLIAEEKRKVKVQRRRQIDPTTCERDYSDDEIAFMQAMDEYKRKNGRMFPTCSEILEVVRSIGYSKVSPSQPSAPPTAED